ncbi:MAG: EamA family transporter [Terriglobales bacterium]
MHPAKIPIRWNVILAFALVYVFWGSTYLGIRIAVEHIPPLLMTGLRFLIAGVLMLVWCAVTGRRVRVTAGEAVRLAVIGALLLSIGNAALSWAEQWVPTGLAALIVSVTPLWFLILETWIFPGEHHVSGRALAGLFFGASGILVLLWPQLRHTSAVGRRELICSAVLMCGSLSWALGSVFSKRWKLKLDSFTAAGYEMLIAGALNLLAGSMLGDWSRAVWSRRSVGAVIYLVIFGSWVGYSAYIWLLNHVPITKVSTYAYVNPMVAVFLGWLILREQITGYIAAGSIIIIVAVALVTGAKLKTRQIPVEPV